MGHFVPPDHQIDDDYEYDVDDDDDDDREDDDYDNDDNNLVGLCWGSGSAVGEQIVGGCHVPFSHNL